MKFESQFIQLSLSGIRYYGIVLVVLVLAISAIGEFLALRRNPERKFNPLNWAVMVGVGAVFAGIWFVLMPSEKTEVQIRYYGIIIVTAMLVATLVAAQLAKRVGKDPEHIYGALTWAIIPGIILARMWFITFPPSTLTDACNDTDETTECRDASWFYNPDNFFDTDNGAIAIWSGGLSIFGALIGGMLGTYVYLRRNKLPLGSWLDIAAVVLPLGQAIGRWANFVNKELYGKPTCTLPPGGACESSWGLNIPLGERAGNYNGLEYLYAKFHPLFAYEAVWSLIAFGVLLFLFLRYRDRFKAGDFFLIYLAQYAVIRFFLEFLRVEVTYLPGTEVNLSQVVCVVGFVVSVGFLLYRHRPGAPAPSAPSVPAETQA